MSHEVYHVGNLSLDRLTDAALDQRAREFLERGTSEGRFVYPGSRGPDSPRGTGEGFLTQRRLWNGVYEYRFTPSRRGS